MPLTAPKGLSTVLRQGEEQPWQGFPSHLGEVPKGGKGGYTVLVCFLRQGSHYINQVGLELIVISLPLPPKFLI